MRALILVAGAALAVSACSSNESADNTMNVDDVNLTAENVVVDNTMDANAMTMDANAAAANADAAAANADAAATNADAAANNAM
jgi:hypothetical protein